MDIIHPPIYFLKYSCKLYKGGGGRRCRGGGGGQSGYLGGGGGGGGGAGGEVNNPVTQAFICPLAWQPTGLVQGGNFGLYGFGFCLPARPASLGANSIDSSESSSPHNASQAAVLE